MCYKSVCVFMCVCERVREGEHKGGEKVCQGTEGVCSGTGMTSRPNILLTAVPKQFM